MMSSVSVKHMSNVLDKRNATLHSSFNEINVLSKAGQNTSSNLHIRLSSSTRSLCRRPPLQKQKLGHRKVDEHGHVTFKTIETRQICKSLQLGIRCSVGRFNVSERDVLMKDFVDVEINEFPAKGTSTTPAHKFDDFRFKSYAPNAFRYFRELFGIPTDDFLLSVCDKPLRELSNPGASGSVFYKSIDDRFIIKTNPDTLLPKFYGLYCYICGTHRVRVVVMNNLLPSKLPVDLKFDLKGSSYKREASKEERNKKCPTLKDLDFMEYQPDGIYLEPATYDSLMKTIKRDCTVLESFNIMDYSLLIGIHLFDQKNQSVDSGTSILSGDTYPELPVKESSKKFSVEPSAPVEHDVGVNFNKGGNDDGKTENVSLVKSLESRPPRPPLRRQSCIQSSFSLYSMLDQISLNSSEEFSNPSGVCTYLPPDVITGRTADGTNMLLFCGIIDILQSYELHKMLEHSFKSIVTDGRTISVTRPDYYATRFQDFLGTRVFKRDKSFPSNRIEVDKPAMTNNLSFIQRKLNTPLLHPGFVVAPNLQPMNQSIFSESSGISTFDDRSIYSVKSSIRSAPALRNNQNWKLQTDCRNRHLSEKLNQELKEELIARRNNLSLNNSITKGRLASRRGYLESIGSRSFEDRSSIFGSSVFDDARSRSYSSGKQVLRVSEHDENVDED